MRTLAVWMANGRDGLPHIDAFLRFNPEVPIHIASGRPFIGSEKKDAWRNCDRTIRRWWLEQGRHLDFERAVFLEWDVLFAARIDEVFPEGDFVAKSLKHPDVNGDWYWFREISRLPEEFRSHATGAVPFAALAVSRRCLEAMMAHPEADYLFGSDIFCELRFPTLASACGFQPRSNPEPLAQLDWCKIVPNGENGVWHSVKSSAGLVTAQTFAPFAGDPFLQAEAARLIGKWGVEVAVETGTFSGHTTVALSHLCPEVFTAEIDARRAEAARRFFAIEGRTNISLLDESSEKAIASLSSQLSGRRALYYLDAHWNSYWPLRDELRAIAEIPGPRPVVVIHDCQVPGRTDLGFDSYRGVPLNFGYVEPGLRKIFPDGFSFHYNSRAAGAKRGALFVEPVSENGHGRLCSGCVDISKPPCKIGQLPARRCLF